MNYPKVNDFLSHITTGTKIVIVDDIAYDYVYYEGNVKGYFESDVKDKDLILMQSYIIRDNIFCVRAIRLNSIDKGIK